MRRGRKPVFLVVDTCVWLELAKDYSQKPLLGALEELIRMNFVGLIVPRIVDSSSRISQLRRIAYTGRRGALRNG